MEQFLKNSSIWNDRIFFLNKNIWLVAMTESKAFMKQKGSLTKVTVIFIFQIFSVMNCMLSWIWYGNTQKEITFQPVTKTKDLFFEKGVFS